jgi:flagellar biogenesis protein FliO
VGKLSNRWLSIVIAVVVVGGLGLYAASAKPAPRAGVTSVPNLSATPETSQPATQPVPGMSAGDMPGLFVKVGIVAGLLGGSLWLLRRYAGPGVRQGGRTGIVNIADTIPLAQGRALYVVDIGDRALVVGATQQQFSLLAEMSDAETLEKLRARPERPAAPWTELSTRLNAAMTAAQAARGNKEQGTGTRPSTIVQPRSQSFAETYSAYVPEHTEPAAADEDLARLAERSVRLREMTARIRETRRSA